MASLEQNQKKYSIIRLSNGGGVRRQLLDKEALLTDVSIEIKKVIKKTMNY